MPSSNDNLLSIVSDMISNRIAELTTSMPAKVESYNPEDQTVDVKPMIKSVIVDANGAEIIKQDYPILANVPVHFSRGGGYYMTFPIIAGDEVLLVISDNSIDEWWENGELVDPIDLREHPIDAAFAIPSIASKPNVITDINSDHMVLGKEGGTQIHITDGSISLGQESPSDFVALASKCMTNFNNLYNHAITHIHPGPTGPVSVTPVPPTAIQEVKSGTVETD